MSRAPKRVEDAAAKQRGYTSTKARVPKPAQQPAVLNRKAKQLTPIGAIVIGGQLRQGLTAEQLAADVAAFEHAGGRVQQLALGEVSKPFERLFRDDLQKPKTTRSHSRIAVAS